MRWQPMRQDRRTARAKSAIPKLSDQLCGRVFANRRDLEPQGVEETANDLPKRLAWLADSYSFDHDLFMLLMRQIHFSSG